MAANLAKWPSNQGLISKIRPSDGCMGIQFRGRWDRGSISTQLDVIWGMSVIPSPARLPPARRRHDAARCSSCVLAIRAFEHLLESCSGSGVDLANFMRTLALPKEVEHWSLTTLREKLVKIGAKVVSHGRYVTFQLAEVAVPRELFRKILGLIDDLRPRPAPA